MRRVQAYAQLGAEKTLPVQAVLIAPVQGLEMLLQKPGQVVSAIKPELSPQVSFAQTSGGQHAGQPLGLMFIGVG
jgi:hypothetical protein